MTPAESILLPVFNAAPFPEEALASLSTQTLQEFEVIAVDDGSTDASLQILERVASADRRFKVLAQHRRGLIFTLNRALEEAASELVARMDADDVAVADRLEKRVGFLHEHGDVAVVGGTMQLIDSVVRPSWS